MKPNRHQPANNKAFINPNQNSITNKNPHIHQPNNKPMNNNKILKTTLLFLSCIILTVLGFTILNADSTTTIGLDINTGDITSTGTITSQDLTIQKSDDTTLTIYSNTDDPTEDDKLLIIQKGTTPLELFSVDEDGDVVIGNDLSVTGNVTLGTSIITQYGGTGQNWSTTTQGNLPYFSDTGTLSNLAPGTTGQFLSQGSDGNPAWDNVARTATFVVAANDSSTLSKQQADYVCSGTDDQVQIQAAIDALTDNPTPNEGEGGTIMLLEGTYFISDTININKPIVTIQGQGWSTVVKLTENCNMFELTGDEQYTHFLDLWLDGGSKTGHAIYASSIHPVKDFYADRLLIAHYSGDGIHLEGGGWHHTITDSTIEQCNRAIYEYAPAAHSLATVIITNNDLKMQSDCDIELNGTDRVIYSVIIGDNYFEDDAIRLQSVRRYSIANNILYSGGGTDGIVLSSCYSGTIAQNTIYDYRGYGIHINGGGHVTINSNFFEQTYKHSIYCDGRYSIITNNIIFYSSWTNDNQYNDIEIDGDGNLVNNNFCYTPTSAYARVDNAIHITAASDDTMCTGNQLSPDGDRGYIYDQSSSSVVRGNSKYITESSGTATLPSGEAKEIAVDHGLNVTPSVGDVMVTPIGTWGAMTKFWIGNYTSSQFTIYADQDPGITVDFAWKAVVL